MLKHVYLGFLNAVNEIDGMRWYLRYHSKEVKRFFGPWLRRYETFKAFPPPEEAKRYGAVSGFYTELWYTNIDEFVEARPGDRPYTFEEWHITTPREGIAGAVTMVPAMPTEDFLEKEPTPEERHILRWVRALKYPEGVSIDEGEKWYAEVHSQEVKQQPGLLSYISYKILPDAPIESPWVRIEELWYEDFAAWNKAVIESPINYTAPSWRNEEPFVDYMSVFIGYKPDIDFLNDNPLIP